MNIFALNKYKFIKEVYNIESEASIIEDFVNNHENSIFPNVDLIKLDKKQIVLHDLFLNESIVIQNVLTKTKTEYILDHSLYLFINLKDFDTAFVIKEMKLNTELLTIGENSEIERCFYEEFLSQIHNLEKTIKKGETEEKKAFLINSVFFIIRYQQANSNKFLDSLFILNSKYFNLKSDGFEVKKLLTSEIIDLRNLFLSLLVETLIKENKITGDKENTEKIIKDNTEKYNKFLKEFRLTLQENSISSLINPEYKEKLISFRKNSNESNTIEFIKNSKEYLNELNAEIEKIKKNIQIKESEFGLKTFIKKRGFLKNTLFVVLIVLSFVLLFILMFK